MWKFTYISTINGKEEKKRKKRTNKQTNKHITHTSNNKKKQFQWLKKIAEPQRLWKIEYLHSFYSSSIKYKNTKSQYVYMYIYTLIYMYKLQKASVQVNWYTNTLYMYIHSSSYSRQVGTCCTHHAPYTCIHVGFNWDLSFPFVTLG